MIRRTISLLAVAAATLLLAAASGVGRPSTALADPAITVLPTTSYAYDTFVFTGAGFAQGTSLKATFTDPSGAAGTVSDNSGNDATVKVSNDGSWELRLQPGSAFHSTATGTYHVSFCQSDAPTTCWSADLTVSNDVPGMAGAGGSGGGY